MPLQASIDSLVDLTLASVEKWQNPSFEQKGVSIDVLRLDKIHPIISGNKWFKLKHYLLKAQQQNKKGIISFGGTYSNHLLAIAFACRQSGLLSIGVIRGEEPLNYSSTLIDLQQYGMQLQFAPRSAFRNMETLVVEWKNQFQDYLVIPAGGAGDEGVRGAGDIVELVSLGDYSHVVCSVGTGTMMVGLLNASLPKQEIIGICSLKIKDSFTCDLDQFIKRYSDKSNFSIFYDYHFGGFGKFPIELVQFMNELFRQYQLPTDLVYTSKLFYAILDLLKKNYFSFGAHILIVHSGGLQGNRSLPRGTLRF